MINASKCIGLFLAVIISTSQARAADPNDTGGAPAADRSAHAKQIAEGGNAKDFDMAPETRIEVVKAAVDAIGTKIPAGPFEPTWDSLQHHYVTPKWFTEAKFGIFLHWGLYSVPAYGGGGAAEWYETHLYAGGKTTQWHLEKYGPLDKFGYKDFIPLFTADKFDPDAWATLFKKSGAKFILPSAQHHDNFSLWDSQVNPWNAAKMGPKRDLIGDLAKAVRKQGLKFGVSNHGIEAFQFVKPNAVIAADLKAKHADIYDPQWADFYHAADRSGDACKKFLIDWAMRNVELIDKYQPDILWFDNGVDMRFLDPIKLWIAAYYYNRAADWKKDVSLSTKKAAFAPDGTNTHTIGSIIDFEKVGARSPAGIRTGSWQVDDPIGSTWGYSDGMHISSPETVITKLVDVVSQNGNFVLNISPKADGTIPDDQQNVLREVGKWLDLNGEAIYGTHAWTQCADGSGGRGSPHIRYTVKDDTLYAIFIGSWPASITLTAIRQEEHVKSVSLLGNVGELTFAQNADGLKVSMPATAPCKFGYALKISGLKTNPTTYTDSGNPN